MQERIELEVWHRELQPTLYEKNEKHLQRFLKKHFLDVEVALNQWHGWAEWRHGERSITSYLSCLIMLMMCLFGRKPCG